MREVTRDNEAVVADKGFAGGYDTLFAILGQGKLCSTGVPFRLSAVVLAFLDTMGGKGERRLETDRPFNDHSVSPCRMTNTRGVVIADRKKRLKGAVKHKIHKVPNLELFLKTEPSETGAGGAQGDVTDSSLHIGQ